MLVYLPLSLLLGASPTSSLVANLVHALATALVAGGVVAYHVRVVRADARRAKPEPPPRVGAAERLVRLKAATMDEIEAALTLLRARGIEVEDAAS
jgi:hypothetical protein